jgi:prophage regulatory protein
MREFEVSRATAFRYLDAYRNFVSARDARHGIAGSSSTTPSHPVRTEMPGTPSLLSPPLRQYKAAKYDSDNTKRDDGMGYVLLPMEAPKGQPPRDGVRGRVGLHPSTIYAEIKAGRFPKPVKLGRSSRWVESEIDAFIEARMHERDGPLQSHPDD